MARNSRGRFAPYILGTGLLGLALIIIVFAGYALLYASPAAALS